MCNCTEKKRTYKFNEREQIRLRNDETKPTHEQKKAKCKPRTLCSFCHAILRLSAAYIWNCIFIIQNQASRQAIEVERQ